MKIRFLAVGVGPDYYSFDDDKVIAHKNGKQSAYDFSEMEDGDIATIGVFGDRAPIRRAEKTGGVLHLHLLQVVDAGFWTAGDWFNVSEYNPEGVHVKLIKTKKSHGVPTAMTKLGVKPISTDEGCQ
ncbi:hypothetical protein ACUN9Y_09745 [Halomonas sp. V046]|uniref:hypothetical protein n=1 Tax=Halomonas sp. V046 TaxID=3459611 RepID=UPI004043AB80